VEERAFPFLISLSCPDVVLYREWLGLTNADGTGRTCLRQGWACRSWTAIAKTDPTAYKSGVKMAKAYVSCYTEESDNMSRRRVKQHTRNRTMLSGFDRHEMSLSTRLVEQLDLLERVG
jgi:tellurite resistance protein